MIGKLRTSFASSVEMKNIVVSTVDFRFSQVGKKVYQMEVIC